MRRWIKGAYDWVGRSLSLTGDPQPWRDLFGAGTYAGKSVDEVSAMQVSAVFGCVRAIAETVGMLPWAVYERGKNGNSEKVDHPLADVLIGSPNPDMTSVEFKEALIANIALNGNAYALIERNGTGNVTSLYPMVSTHVCPQRDKDTGDIEYRFNDRGRWQTLPREKVWHTKGFGANGLIGYSPIACMRQAVGLALATEEFGARFFGQGATMSGVVTTPSFLTKEQRVEARTVLSQKYEGLGNAHKLMLLEGGMTYQGVSMNLDDAEYLLLRGFQVEEICRTYRVPPHVVGKLDRATFANIEQMSIEFAVYCLSPYNVRLETSAGRWLLKPGDRSKYFVRFNMDGLLRGEVEARWRAHASALQNGVLSRNEVRALENRNRVDGQGMDDYTVQQNMIDVNELAKLVAQKLATSPTNQPGLRVAA